MKDKRYIIGEIQRTAESNGGEPLGQRAFEKATGISRHQWKGRYWVRWPDALSEAGFKPLEGTPAFDVEDIIEEIAKLIRKYGRYPVEAEILFEKRGNGNERIPSPGVLRSELGRKPEAIKRIIEYCSPIEDLADVIAILSKDSDGPEISINDGMPYSSARQARASGYVYLVKSGKLYKIGCTENHWRRKSELHKQTAEGISEVHTIAAIDDAPGIEKYWHDRFADKRQHGEWFDLSPEDIGAFRKRKWM